LKVASPHGQEAINKFLHSHGTILFFIDELGVRRMEKTFPDYAVSCPN
jgi:predicted oxidoreductase (fatty acid repression mutant protein)